MRATFRSYVIVLLAAISPLHAMAANCAQQASRSLRLDAAGATKILITAGAGDLQIKGERGATQLAATGQACASNQTLLDKIQLEGRRDGATLIVKTVLPEAEGFLGYAKLDLSITLPDSMELNVQDSSGDTRIQNVGALTLTDSSGDLELRGITGDVDLNDSSGDMQVAEVTGRITLSDSSGDIRIEQVSGEVEIQTDSSGGIDIDRVGAVHILTDSSGDIVINNVRGDVLIDNDSSGDITVNEVGGKFTVRSDSSGSIRQQRVAGPVTLPR